MLKLKMMLFVAWVFSTALISAASSRSIVAHSTGVPTADPSLTFCTIPGGDFALTASPVNVTITGPSSRASSTVTVTSLHGFSGTLSLKNSTSATGLNITLSKTSVTISKLTPGTAALTITNSTILAPGFYTVNVTATNSTISHKVTVNVLVPMPGYRFSGAPSPAAAVTIVTVVAGSTNFTTLTATSLNGFAGKVNLTAYAPYTGFSASTSKPSLTLTIGGTAQFNVTISTTSLARHGTYSIQVTGTSGSFSNSTFFGVQVIGPDFRISASPTMVSLGPSSTASSTVNMTRVMNFNGTITLRAMVFAIPPFMASFASPTVTLSATRTSATDLLTITTSSTPYNTYGIIVNATSGTIQHFVVITVTVSGLDMFSSKNAISVNAGGASNSAIITLQSINGFSGNVTLFGVCQPAGGLVASVSPSSVLLSNGGMVTSTLTVSAATDSPPGNYTVVLIGRNITVTPNVAIVANFTFVKVTVYGPDFKLTTATNTVSFAGGTSATSTITVTSLLGFTGDVSFTYFIIPNTGLTVSCTTVTGAMGSSTCTYTSSTIGTYAVLITGTSGTITHSVSIAVFVSAFAVGSSPSSVTFTAGATGTSTIVVSPASGFSGTVGLSLSPTPPGISCSLSVLSTGPPYYPTSTLSCTGTPGSYTVTVIATSGTQVQPTSVSFTITSTSAPDFSLTASSPPAVNTGVSATSTISLSGQNGFSGTVTLSVTPASGLSCTISPTSVTLPSSTTATLSCSSPTLGTYPVTITGTSGTTSHTQTVNVTVNSSPSNSSPQPYLLYGLAGLLVVAVAFTGVALYARKRKKIGHIDTSGGSRT